MTVALAVIDVRTERELYWLDLNSSFPVDTIIPANTLHSTPVPGAQWQGQGAFFTDANLTTMYSFAGFGQPEKVSLRDTVETFNTSSQTWGDASISGGANDSLARLFHSSATTATSGLGLNFIIGVLNDTPEPQAIIQFDASEPDSLHWTTETQNVPYTAAATMQYARFGSKGVLIVVGGFVDVCTLKIW